MSFLARHKLAIILSVLALAGLSWVVYSVLHNINRRLDKDRLQRFRDLWSANGPKDYRLKYTIRLTGSAAPDRFEARIVAGKAVEAWANGEPEPATRLHNYGMDRLFDYIERFLEMHKIEPAKAAQHFADFDSRDGHLLRYQRHLTGQSVEIVVEGLTRD